MSDDLVKRAREWNFCWPSHDVEMLVPAMADRIEKLEAAIKRQAGAAKTLRAFALAEVQHLSEMDRSEYFAAHTLDSEREANAMLTDRIEELEAKLAVAHATGKLDGIQEAAIVARQALIDGAYIKRGSHQEKPSSVMFLAETLVSNAIGSLIPALAKIKGEQV